MKKTARQRVFETLHAAGARGCTTGELCQPSVGGVRFSARIMELREEGHLIDRSVVRVGSHRYVLRTTDCSPAPSPPDAAPSPLQEGPGALFDLQPPAATPVSAVGDWEDAA